MTEMVLIVPQCLLKGGLVIGIICASVPNWFPNDNLWKKSQIEAKCGICPY
jgi:hypothetical protein